MTCGTERLPGDYTPARLGQFLVSLIEGDYGQPFPFPEPAEYTVKQAGCVQRYDAPARSYSSGFGKYSAALFPVVDVLEEPNGDKAVELAILKGDIIRQALVKIYKIAEAFLDATQHVLFRIHAFHIQFIAKKLGNKATIPDRQVQHRISGLRPHVDKLLDNAVLAFVDDFLIDAPVASFFIIPDFFHSLKVSIWHISTL